MCSRGGSSDVFIFLMWEGSLLVTTGTAVFTLIPEKVTLSSSSAGEDNGAFANRPSGDEAPPSFLTKQAFFCWTFCLRILSSLCTLTGSPNFFSNCKMSAGMVWCWSGDALRKFSIARGMLISQSLVHSLTCKVKYDKSAEERFYSDINRKG